MIVGGQGNTLLKHVITWGRERRVPRAFSPKRWAMPMGGSRHHLAHEEHVLKPHETLRPAITPQRSPSAQEMGCLAFVIHEGAEGQKMALYCLSTLWSAPMALPDKLPA
jgi:hypothetical protein